MSTAQTLSELSLQEVLHLAWFYEDSFQRYILAHPTIISDKKLREQAQKISEELSNFYQLVGKHPR